MCACVLSKTISAVEKLIRDRDYVPCRGVLQTSSKVALKLLALRKKRRNFFSLLLKGPYRYKLLDMSLDDDGILIASGEPVGHAATAGDPSQLKDSTLVSAKSLGEYKLNSDTDIVSSAQLTSIDDTVTLEAGLDTSESTSTSLLCLNVTRIEGVNLERLIKELQNKWRINKEHRLWKHITGEDKHELCFISSIVSTEKKVTLRCKHRASGGFTALLEKLIKLSMDVTRASSHYLVLPAGAAFAYKVQPLEIDPSTGGITVSLGKMATSGDDGTQIDPDREIEDCRQYYSEFFGKLSEDKQTSLRKALMKYLSLDSARPTCESLNEVKDGSQRDSSSGSDDGSVTTGDASRQRLVQLKKKAKAALPTDAEPKQEKIADLLRDLDVSGLLDVPDEPAAVYGIRYFITALLQLSPELLDLFSNYFHTAGDGWQILNDLERLIDCMADGTVCEMSFLRDTSIDDDSFLLSWRAAYMAAVHMFGLPVV